jgi:hypothetical protein
MCSTCVLFLIGQLGLMLLLHLVITQFMDGKQVLVLKLLCGVMVTQ